MPHDTPLLATLAAALLAAGVLGLLAQRLRFSPDARSSFAPGTSGSGTTLVARRSARSIDALIG